MLPLVKSILIAEDHPLVLLGMQQMLTDMLAGVEVAKADNFQRVLRILDQRTFDLIIMDINMPGGDKVGMVDLVRQKRSDIPILICSSYDEKIYALPFLKAGANGFVSKTAPTADFKNAVETVLNGRIYASTDVLQAAFGSLSGHSSRDFDGKQSLTAKELEIANFLCQGLSTKSISELVNLSTPSVSNYKARIFAKLGVSNVIELTRFLENIS
jgi:two-component system invasion response regulator UvrY